MSTPEPPPPGPARWAPWSGFVALLAALTVALFGAIVVGAIAAAFGASIDDPPPGVLIADTVVQDVALVVVAVLFARTAGPLLPRDFGIVPAPLRSAVRWVLAGWAIFFAFTIAWSAALGLDEEDDLPDELGADESTAALIGVAVLVTVIAPISEEVFFRGYLFRSLRNWRGPWPAAILTGVVFGGIHVVSSPVGFVVPLMVFGAVLCLVYARTGSLLPCMALHALNNSLALGVQQGWDAGVVLAVMAGANLVIGAIAAPLARGRAPAG